MTNASSKTQQNVAWQAIWYTIAYCNTFVWPFIFFILEMFVPRSELYGKEGTFGLYLLQVLVFSCVPLQGAFNFIIYIRPKYYEWKRVLLLLNDNNNNNSNRYPNDIEGEAATSSNVVVEEDNASVVVISSWVILKKILTDEPIPSLSARTLRNAKRRRASSMRSIGCNPTTATASATSNPKDGQLESLPPPSSSKLNEEDDSVTEQTRNLSLDDIYVICENEDDVGNNEDDGVGNNHGQNKV